MKAKLEETVADNNEVETSLRKKKMQEEEKVTEWIAEYDSEMIAKEKVLQEEKAVYDEVYAAADRSSRRLRSLI